MRKGQRNKEHQKVIKYMRRYNKQIANDDYLGIDRFRIDLYSEDWYRYSDGSGGHLNMIFKMTDSLTGNSAYFLSDNYMYAYDMLKFLNDFLIRCSSGRPGHYPQLSYIAYDVHEIKPYAADVGKEIGEIKAGVIGTYSYVKLIGF